MSVPSLFSDVKLAAPVAVFKLRDDYLADTSPLKINLGVGAYRDPKGEPWVLPVVRSVEAQMVNDPGLNHEYLPIAGLPAFCKEATKLCLGSDSPANGRAGGVQALSGTGALRLAAEFLRRYYNPHDASTRVYVPDPTWGNHHMIFGEAGFKDRPSYRYWDQKNRSLDMDGLKEDLMNAPEYSIVILHACAHNPTGVDPTHEQWKEIAAICKQKNHFPVFDSAYQGFASGDPDADAFSIRHFVEQGFELFVCQSFAKNFGLYNERVGNIVMVMRDAVTLTNSKSQMELIVRAMYSNPPNHGARIVATALSNTPYLLEWKENIRTMSERIKDTRRLLFDELKILGTPGNWEHIINQIGMFSYTGLTPAQCDFLIQKRHIYLMKSGRISVCGLTKENVGYFAKSVYEAVTTVTDNKL